MKSNNELEKYLSNGIEKIVKGIFKASVTNPKSSLFMMKHMITSKKSRDKRKNAEIRGEHIPPFLIASITNECNLHCKGCYARANHSCMDICSNNLSDRLMTEKNWGDIFTQSEELGIEFILLAGGEPFIRKDVLLQAGNHSNIIFPIFTNGTKIDESYIKLLEQKRNLIPVISIEGHKETTDKRRGEGIYEKLEEVMERLRNNGILFGASVTVTKNNMKEVLSDEFVSNLKKAGTKGIVYVEYVPINKETRDLAPDDETREEMMVRLDYLRSKETDMVLVAFPGDERATNGCLAAGRGFFHINAYGDAEPCPFSPYSDTNLLKTSLREALSSPLFCKLKEKGNLEDEHVGGCVLFEKQEHVQDILKGNTI